MVMKIIKFSETITSEMIEIGIPVTLLNSQNLKNLLKQSKVNYVSIHFFFKLTLKKLT